MAVFVSGINLLHTSAWAWV